MPHTFLEHSHYPRQRQDHLDVGIGFGGKPAELLHGALLVNLVWFLHSDSPFSWKKNFPEAITPRGVRVATFYDLPGCAGETEDSLRVQVPSGQSRAGRPGPSLAGVSVTKRSKRR